MTIEKKLERVMEIGRELYFKELFCDFCSSDSWEEDWTDAILALWIEFNEIVRYFERIEKAFREEWKGNHHILGVLK